MSVNSSSPSSSSPDSVLSQCFSSPAGFLISATFNITKAVLLLPLSVFILYLGLQRWRRQRSFTATSHSDIFTYHVAAVGLIWGLGTALFCCSSYNDLPEMMMVGLWLSAISYFGENVFHLLTCVERYLAVVHPVTYLGLRKTRGVRIRNVTIGCAWLLSLLWAGITTLQLSTSYSIPFFCIMVFSLVVVCFCSLSVLRVLIRPGPGDRGQDKERVDQSKQKAFITIMAIMVVLLLWTGGALVSYALDVSPLLSDSVGCVLKATVFWFSLPSSLVLPLLYLHRAGKLSCSCLSSE